MKKLILLITLIALSVFAEYDSFKIPSGNIRVFLEAPEADLSLPVTVQVMEDETLVDVQTTLGALASDMQDAQSGEKLLIFERPIGATSNQQFSEADIDTLVAAIAQAGYSVDDMLTITEFQQLRAVEAE